MSEHTPPTPAPDTTDHFRLVVELNPDAIFVHRAGRIVYVNPAGVQYTGARSRDEIVGRAFADFVHPDSAPDLIDRLVHLAGIGATTPPVEAVMLRCDGEPVVSEVVAVRTTWDDSPAFAVTLRDISARSAAESALRYKAALLESINDAIIATTAEGDIETWNAGAETVYGHVAADTIGQPVHDVVGAELDPKRIVADGGVVEATHRRADGTPVHVRISAAETDSGYVLVCADDSTRRQAQQRFSTVVTSLHQGVVVVGAAGYVELANPAAGKMFGRRADSLVGLHVLDLPLRDRRGSTVAEHDHPVLQALRAGAPKASRSFRFERADGRSIWLSISCRPLDPDEPHSAVVASFTDITEQTAAGDRLRYDATHDSLTGLANRATVIARLDAALKRQAAGLRIAVHFVDLDQFKLINDSLGHITGDEVLRIAAERLRHAVRANDVVGRLGGDEFVVVKVGTHTKEAVAAQAERLRTVLAEPMAVDGRQLHVSASIGIVIVDGTDGRSSADLLRDADIAMYEAKWSGRARCEIFHVAMRERIQRRAQLEQDLRAAPAAGNLWVAYQPIVDLRTRLTVAVESLLRWSHPVYGSVPPAEFVPLAEQSDLIGTIGTHVLTEAAGVVAAQRNRSNSSLQLAVNLSARQTEDPHLVTTVRDIVHDAGLPPGALCVEITESALMREPDATGATLHALRRLGVRLAIDDFGTGYSSLAQLHRLPLDILKIGQPFVAELGASHDAEAIVTSIIAMARATGLVVVAEGVETGAQLDALVRLGCDYAQGYYLGRPVAATEAFGWHAPATAAPIPIPPPDGPSL